jgi:hypothetical protein
VPVWEHFDVKLVKISRRQFSVRDFELITITLDDPKDLRLPF